MLEYEKRFDTLRLTIISLPTTSRWKKNCTQKIVQGYGCDLCPAVFHVILE